MSEWHVHPLDVRNLLHGSFKQLSYCVVNTLLPFSEISYPSISLSVSLGPRFPDRLVNLHQNFTGLLLQFLDSHSISPLPRNNAIRR